jgi:type II secretory pathway pseudopilin PulG
MPRPPEKIVRCPSLRRGGFSFIEVLFAVILLGIGFIMIAGIFPVAIQQSTATANETNGQLICRDAIRMIEQVATSSGGSALFPVTSSTAVPPAPGVFPLVNQNGTPAGVLCQALGPNSFFTADHRYGWVGFYRRDLVNNVPSPFVQVFIIALQNPNFATYGTPATPLWPPPVPPNTYGETLSSIPTASPIQAQFSYDTGTGNSCVYLTSTAAGGGDPAPNACTGAFLLVATDATGDTPGLVGRIFRLGNNTGLANPAYFPKTGTFDTFQLQPGADLNTYLNAGTNSYASPDALATPTGQATVFIIGRAPELATGLGPFTGPNQDIATMSAYIRVNTASN